MAAERVKGACLCRAVQYEVELPTLFCAHCHCSLCRRAHGAGFVTWTSVPPERLHYVAGRDLLTQFRSSEHGTRSFCRNCGSTLFFESAEWPDRVDVVLANLEAPIDRRPEFHVFFSDRADWVEVNDALPRLGGATGMEPL